MKQLPDFAEIAENLEFLDDWEDRYRYLIELGSSVPPITDAERTPGTKVSGCVSQVWLVVEATNQNGKTLVFRGDSDAMIVKGLVAVLIALYSGKTPEEITQIDAISILDGLGLREHLTSQRSNGLLAMVQRIRQEAQSHS
jgi:cysteine desulfuration protein SufE